MSPLYLAYLSATAVFVITPGSTTVVVIRNTLAGGHRAGLMAALGAALGNATHASLAGLGLWVLVGRWPVLLEMIRVGGGAYLAWLGVRSLARAWPRRRPPAGVPLPVGAESAAARHRPSFLEGLTVNLLNPAIITFYLAVVPTFVPPSPPRGYFALLAASHVSMALVSHAAWARGFHTLRQVFARPGVGRTVEVASGAALLWLAARVLGQR